MNIKEIQTPVGNSIPTIVKKTVPKAIILVLSAFKNMIEGAFGINISNRVGDDPSFVDEMTKKLKESTANLLKSLEGKDQSTPESLVLNSLVAANNTFVNQAEKMKSNVKNGIFTEEFKKDLNEEFEKSIEGIAISVRNTPSVHFKHLNFSDKEMASLKEKISISYGSPSGGEPMHLFSDELSSKVLSSLKGMSNLHTQTHDDTLIGNLDPINAALTIKNLREYNVPDRVISMVQEGAERKAREVINDNRVDMALNSEKPPSELIEYCENQGITPDELYSIDDGPHLDWYIEFRERFAQEIESKLDSRLTLEEINSSINEQKQVEAIRGYNESHQNARDQQDIARNKLNDDAAKRLLEESKKARKDNENSQDMSPGN